MSKIAILSDIHGNLPALEAVLRDVEECGADQIVFLGDIVGYGASPAECVNLVRRHGGCCVMGNHDAEIRQVRRRGASVREPNWRSCAYHAGLAHAARCLDMAQAEWLAALPFRLRIPGAWIAHASLNEPQAFEYVQDAASATPTLSILRKERNKLGFFGHTHEIGVFAEDPARLEWLDAARVRIPADTSCAVTVGSVGQSRHETDRRATWALWDTKTREVTFRHTDYDRIRAVRDIIDTGLPLESGLRLLTNMELQVLGS